MQNVTFSCDSCGVKFESCPPSAVKDADAAAFQFFRIGAQPTLVQEMVTPRDPFSPSHATHAFNKPRSADVCSRCAETKPLLELLK